MTKKLKPEQRPVCRANLVPILQSRIAHRGKYIASAETVLKEQREIVKTLRQLSGGTLPPEAREHVNKVLTTIRTDIRELAREQKLDRTTLRLIYDYNEYTGFFGL